MQDRTHYLKTVHVKMRLCICFLTLVTLATAGITLKPRQLNAPLAEAFFREALEKYRQTVLNGNQELGIPVYDPYVLGNIQIKNEDHQSKLSLIADEVAIQNLSRYRVSNVSMSSSGGLSFVLTVPSLKLEGSYGVDGSLEHLQPLFGQGPYGIAAHAVEIIGRATMVQSKTLELKNLQLDLKYKALATRFTNLAARGSSEVGTRDLNTRLGRILATRIFSQLTPALAQSMAVFLNNEIRTNSHMPLAGETGNANDYMDQVLALVRERIIEQGLDRIKLPDGDISFSVPVWPIGDVYGGVYLHDGFIGGFETIHRVGDATLSYVGDDIFFESDLAINNGMLGYALTISFMDIGPTASMTGVLEYANFYFKARVSLASGEVLIEEYNIKEIGHISTDITGLGIFNWLAEIIADFAINLIKGFVKEILEGPIKAIIQWALDEILAYLTGTTTAATAAYLIA